MHKSNEAVNESCVLTRVFISTSKFSTLFKATLKILETEETCNSIFHYYDLTVSTVGIRHELVNYSFNN